ncbi:hypothetical protein SVAN01_11642, partial [Stagonosporopsis vannaccii]
MAQILRLPCWCQWMRAGSALGCFSPIGSISARTSSRSFRGCVVKLVDTSAIRAEQYLIGYRFAAHSLQRVRSELQAAAAGHGLCSACGLCQEMRDLRRARIRCRVHGSVRLEASSAGGRVVCAQLAGSRLDVESTAQRGHTVERQTRAQGQAACSGRVPGEALAQPAWLRRQMQGLAVPHWARAKHHGARFGAAALAHVDQARTPFPRNGGGGVRARASLYIALSRSPPLPSAPLPTVLPWPLAGLSAREPPHCCSRSRAPCRAPWGLCMTKSPLLHANTLVGPGGLLDARSFLPTSSQPAARSLRGQDPEPAAALVALVAADLSPLPCRRRRRRPAPAVAHPA